MMVASLRMSEEVRHDLPHVEEGEWRNGVAWLQCNGVHERAVVNDR